LSLKLGSSSKSSLSTTNGSASTITLPRALPTTNFLNDENFKSVTSTTLSELSLVVSKMIFHSALQRTSKSEEDLAGLFKDTES